MGKELLLDKQDAEAGWPLLATLRQSPLHSGVCNEEAEEGPWLGRRILFCTSRPTCTPYAPIQHL